ncbi:hypothetical protein V8G54_016278 [Vigna mungo]|uniref:Uncharacterized protein n=1 Tax=Vigna mungo TaxID=3915 RepID=A0AAQ3S0A4_VIGMU
MLTQHPPPRLRRMTALPRRPHSSSWPAAAVPARMPQLLPAPLPWPAKAASPRQAARRVPPALRCALSLSPPLSPFPSVAAKSIAPLLLTEPDNASFFSQSMPAAIARPASLLDLKEPVDFIVLLFDLQGQTIG